MPGSPGPPRSISRASERQLRDLVEFGTLELAGKGDLAGDYRRQGKNFTGYVSALFQDLRIGGLVASPLERDELRLEAAFADRPSAGLPRDSGRLELKLSHRHAHGPSRGEAAAARC